MKIRHALFILAALSIPAGILLGNRDDNMEPARAFFLQKGNAEAGKKAFADLKCFACHQVQGAKEFPAPPAAKPGPVLSKKQAGYAAGWIANSIVSPSHTIALNSEGTAEGSDLSRMGDFTDTMTVRQMMDLVAYIQSLGSDEEVK